MKCFWLLIALLLYIQSSQPYLWWIIFPRSYRSLPTKSVFQRILTKAFCQYTLNLMLKKKLGSFNDLINAYFQSFLCLPRYEHSLASIFVKFPWHCWTEFSQSWKDLRKTFWSHENLRSLTDLSSANIGIHSNLQDWLFWMFLMSKMNPLMNKSMLFLFFLIGIPCHYEAWSYENEKEAQKRLQHIGNMFRKNLQFKDVC